MPRTYYVADVVARLAVNTALIATCFLIGAGLMSMYIGLVGFSEFDIGH